MKTEFRAKFLQHLNRKDTEKGFTLIELLVVIIIIGILSAIALPSFLSQANKAKQTEAKQYIASLNKGQQAYYVENNSFVDQANIGSMGLGLKTGTNNYTYNIGATSANGVSASADPGTTSALRAYSGGVALVTPAGASEKTTSTVICENTASGTGPDAPNLTVDPPVCGGASKPVTK